MLRQDSVTSHPLEGQKARVRDKELSTLGGPSSGELGEVVDVCSQEVGFLLNPLEHRPFRSLIPASKNLVGDQRMKKFGRTRGHEAGFRGSSNIEAGRTTAPLYQT